MATEEKENKTPAPRKKRTTEEQALKKVMKRPAKKVDTDGNGSAGRKRSSGATSSRSRSNVGKTSVSKSGAKTSSRDGSRGNKPLAKPRRSWKLRVMAWLLLLLTFTGLGFGGWKFWNSDFVQTRFVYMWDYQQDIVNYSEKNNIDPFLVAAIIKNESNFDHKAVSNVGAVGLMQIMPETGQWIANQMGLKNYEDGDLYKVQTNIRMGCWYVSELDSEFHHNLTLLMMAYNAGRGQTKAWMKENNWDYNFNDPRAIPYKETREYVIKVLHDRDRYYQLYREKLKKK